MLHDAYRMPHVGNLNGTCCGVSPRQQQRLRGIPQRIDDLPVCLVLPWGSGTWQTTRPNPRLSLRRCMPLCAHSRTPVEPGTPCPATAGRRPAAAVCRSTQLWSISARQCLSRHAVSQWAPSFTSTFARKFILRDKFSLARSRWTERLTHRLPATAPRMQRPSTSSTPKILRRRDDFAMILFRIVFKGQLRASYDIRFLVFLVS